MNDGDLFQPLLIRPFSSLEEYEACAAFQEEVWGEGFSEKVSGAILMIANRIGGLSAGAFDQEGRLQGFVFGLTGVEDGRLVHWSDMLAVRNHLRDQGLGTRLKEYQREVLLGRGVGRMYWTFDPLQSRNAYVNFCKLGITSREYVRDMYGETGSPLHGGLGTDRLVATWEMASTRVEGRMSGEDLPPAREDWVDLPVALGGEKGGEFPVPGTPVLVLDEPSIRLSIPRRMDALMEYDPALALRWREATREALLHYLKSGYQVTELVPDGDLSHYLLETASLSEESSWKKEEEREGTTA